MCQLCYSLASTVESFAACLPAFGHNPISESALRPMGAILAEKAACNPAQRKLELPRYRPVQRQTAAGP